MGETPSLCPFCASQAARIAELEQELADLRRYCTRLHDQVHRDAEELARARDLLRWRSKPQ